MGAAPVGLIARRRHEVVPLFDSACTDSEKKGGTHTNPRQALRRSKQGDKEFSRKANTHEDEYSGEQLPT